LPTALISIVEDDESMRLALAGLVRSFGLEAKTYDSAEDFLRSGAGEPWNCIITDIQLPGISGIELKRWLDEQANTAPVIMITAHSEARLHAQALASGAFTLLKKPFDADDLLACLRMARVVTSESGIV
jgi:FixJ family two-component response regulator